MKHKLLLFLKIVILKINSFRHYILGTSPTRSIITVHNIKNIDQFKFVIHNLRHKYSITSIDNLLNFNYQSEKPLISLSFDDGYKEWATELLKYSEEEKLPLLMFICSGSLFAESNTEKITFLNQNFLRRDHSLNLLNFNDIRRLSQSEYITLGGHTFSHLDLGAVSNFSTLFDDIMLDKMLLESISGKKLKYFAYPFGKKCNISDKAVSLVKEAGYSHAFTIESGSISSETNPYLLPRYSIDPDLPLSYWNAVLSGGKIF